MKLIAPFIVALCSLPFAACRSTPTDQRPGEASPASVTHTDQRPGEASPASVTPADLTARSLTIVDDAGKPRLRMAVAYNVAPTIEFLDQTGESVASARLFDARGEGAIGGPSKQGFAITAEVGASGHVGNFVVTEDAVALVMADSDEQGWSLTLHKGVVSVGLSCKTPNTSKDGETIDLDVILAVEDGRLVLKTADGNVLGSFAVPTTHSKDTTSSTGKMSVTTKP